MVANYALLDARNGGVLAEFANAGEAMAAAQRWECETDMPGFDRNGCPH